jgi:predicted nucleic acid-binding protein
MPFVIDASVAIKWVISEPDSAEAETLRWADRLLAPELIAAEWANALWKKVRRAEITSDEAFIAARALEQGEVELLPMRGLLAAASQLAIALDHPAYDCFYLGLATAERCAFVTGDQGLVRKLSASGVRGLPDVIALRDAAQLLSRP